MTKISTLSDQPFSFSPKNVIFGVKIMKFLIPGQNFGIFASSIKGMDTFLFEMSMKWMFRFKNFRNVYWHGKTHSAVMMMSNYYILYEHFDLCNNHVLLDQSEVGLLCYLFWIFWIFFYLCSNLQQTLIGVREGISSTRYESFEFLGGS